MEQNFYSIDRLVEFGMGMAAAQQMVKSMNETMAAMHIPGVQNSFTRQRDAAPQCVYYAALDGKPAGPFSETEIVRLIAEKKISRETLLWHPGLITWKSAEDVPEIVRLAALTPPAIGGQT